MRVKIIKQHKKYSIGQVVEVSPNEGFGLIDAGYAIVSRDFTQQDATAAREKQRSKSPPRESQTKVDD